MRRPTEIFFRTLSAPIVFTLLMLGIHFLLRGHNSPGGGFIAGLMVAFAALIMRMARDETLLIISPDFLLPAGLIVAAITGLVPMLFGKPFLTSAHGMLNVPGFGPVEWSSAAIFDVGVFMVVIGTTVAIIDALSREGGHGEGEMEREE